MTVNETSSNAGTDRVRQPAVAGMFYPERPEELEKMVEALLARAPAAATTPKAIIAPHAGYPFSGPVAARAYATLQAARDRIRRVVLMGPAHRVYLRGLALPDAGHFATPLGLIDIDQEAIARIRDLPQITVMPEAHREEHSLEVHLPFLQRCLERFSLVPLVVGDAPPEQVAEVLEHLWGEDDTLILISSDLSHYNDYDTASRLDRTTADHIRALQLEAIGPHQACGCMPVNGLLHLARRRNLHVDVLDVRNSGDTAGPRDRVVGYGSFAVYPSGGTAATYREQLHGIARDSIARGLRGEGPLRPGTSGVGDVLAQKRAAFVTLFLDDRLRGCIGTTEAEAPLINAVADAAYRAAFHDPRFPPLSEPEFERIELRISVLSPERPLRFASEAELLAQLQPGVHGLTIARGSARATFLPAVWEQLPEPGDFLQRLKQKAGLGEDAVPDEAWVYTTESF